MENISSSSILAVDDTKMNLDILVSILDESYEVSVALNGENALHHIEEFLPDLILLDIMMPGMDGYEVLERLKSNKRSREIPVIVLTAISESEKINKCFEMGAVDYIIKPFLPVELRARVKTHLSLGRARQQLVQQNEQLEEKVDKRTTELLTTQQAVIESMAALAEYRDPETGHHISRVKGYTELLARKMCGHSQFSKKMNETYIRDLIRSTPLHDIGKVGISDAILLKPGPLSKEEFELMKLHAEYGRDAITSVQKKVGNLPFLEIAQKMTYSHHEKWDGTGYPQGLSGEEIPLCARIMAIADVYDALICRRIYKPPHPHSTAIKIIAEGSGTHFDPVITEIFLDSAEEIKQIAIANLETEEQRQTIHR